jgi:hypothetical protein
MPLLGGLMDIPFQKKPVWFDDVPRMETVARLPDP